jgi:CMP-N,N'-diacetyllegionaminic acid synthase
MSILITICARGGSKGIPGKNIRNLAGRPLIDYSIAIAKKFAENSGGFVALSTESEEIKTLAASCGLNFDYTRPGYLASDTAGKLETLKDLLFFEEKKNAQSFDYLLDLDVTSPLRTIKDLEDGFKIFLQQKEALTLFSVNKAARNPYFNMVEKKSNNFFNLIKTHDEFFLTRQSAPAVYDMNASFYFYRRKFFDMEKTGPITDRSLIYEMPHICFDLDHLIDFEFMEYLIQNNKLDFQLI